jgi:LSD1 subclass zinc finger protein
VLDYVDLEQLIPRQGAAGEPISGTRDPKSPLALGAEALQRTIWRQATSWEVVVRKEARLFPGNTRVRDGFAIQRAVFVLRRHLVLLAMLAPVLIWPDGPGGESLEISGASGILALVALHGWARSMTGITRKVIRLPGECSGCKKPTLRRDEGSDTVHCAFCHRRWPIEEYQDYVRMSLERM